MGTSLTADHTGGHWVPEVDAAIVPATQKQYVLYNYGQPGWVAANGLTLAPSVAATRPSIAVLEFAMNDAYTPNGISVATFEASMRAMIAAFTSGSPQTSVLLMTMNPAISPGASTVPNLAAYYQKVRDIAADLGKGLIDNTPLWGTPTSGQIPDGIHPTAAAQKAVMVPNVAAALIPFLT